MRGFMGRANLLSKQIIERKTHVRKNAVKKRVNFAFEVQSSGDKKQHHKVQKGRSRTGTSVSKYSEAFTFKDSHALEKFGEISDTSSFEERNYTIVSRQTLKNKFKI